MRIIGRGFIAQHLLEVADRHDDVVALAAGVSFPTNPVTAYEREQALVESVVAECLREDRKLVFMSSAAVYGREGVGGSEDMPPDPPTPYGDHKAALEALIRGSGVRHVSLRLGYVLGRAAPHHRLVPSLVRQIRGGTVTVHRDAYRDLLHVRDMVTIVAGLLDAGVENEIVNVASGRCVPIAWIVRHVERRLDMQAAWDVSPEGARHCMSIEKMSSLLEPLMDLDFPPMYFRTVIDDYLLEAGVVSDPTPGPRLAVVPATTRPVTGG